MTDRELNAGGFARPPSQGSMDIHIFMKLSKIFEEFFQRVHKGQYKLANAKLCDEYKIR